MTDDTTPPTPDDAPQDLSAPKRHTLPSGKIVEVRSHRTLDGRDVAAVLAAQSGTGSWVGNTVDMRGELIRRLVTEIEPGRGSAPGLDGSLDAVLAQRGDDYRALYKLVDEAMALSMGISVIPDFDDYADPKAPTTDSSGPSPSSEDEPLP